MYHSTFISLSELLPGPKWLDLFAKHWPAYRRWFLDKGNSNVPTLKYSVEQLRRFMPELLPTYEQLCALTGGDEVACRFLTGYQPPVYIGGCSQMVWHRQLVRNYDYHPHLSEGTLLHSAWNGRQVIATGDCLWGVVDGMNESGLVASLTFGGRKVSGPGFGIPFILRYVLEFCSDVPQAVDALCRIPSHMAYNVVVLDKSGDFKTVQLAPDQKPVVLSTSIATNHQSRIDWPEYARFSKTLEREKYLLKTVANHSQQVEDVVEAFLRPPLFNQLYNAGFGTIYTALYQPAEGQMELRWPKKKLQQSFLNFIEGVTPVSYSESPIPMGLPKQESPHAYPGSEEAAFWMEYGRAWAMGYHPKAKKHG